MANNELPCRSLECDPCERPVFDYSLVNYPLYFNSELTFLIPCPEGFICTDAEGNIIDEVSVTIPANTISFRPTTSEQNDPDFVSGELERRARQRAEDGLTPSAPPTGGFPPGGGLNPRPRLFYNDPVVVECSEGRVGDFPNINGFTGPGQVSWPSGVFSSTVSNEHATLLALINAQFLLDTYGNCHWENDEVVLQCPDGGMGGPIIVLAGTFTSLESKADANQQAMDYAEQQIPAVCFWLNEEVTCDCTPPETGGPFTIPAGTYQSFESQAAANALADAACQALVEANCGNCTNPVSDLSWSQVGPFGAGSTGSASGGSGSAHLDGTANDNLTFEAHLQDSSCSPYDITIEVNWDLNANNGAFPPFPPFPKSFLQVLIDDVLVLDEFVESQMGGGCSNTNGTQNLVHTIDPDAYSIANGFHKIKFSFAQDAVGGTCECDFDFSITPLTPP